ncbi:MAG: D-2-hydroxyacid dehydrogenase [Pseudomonadota bacterium]|nr:D-2-hydroxyacid dehydrogenase [Pseudomonadota bacterium]
MNDLLFPGRDDVTIHFAHSAYRMAERFALRELGIRHFQTDTAESTRGQITQSDVLVVSGFWHDSLLEHAPRLRYIQSISAGYDQYGLDALHDRGVLLANASGVNADAVAHHAIGLSLALVRQLHSARDYQKAHHWRGMVSAIDQREDDLVGHTALIVGLGAIGERVALLAKAFGMAVLATKRDTTTHQGVADEVHPPEALPQILPRADFVRLCCPLTDATTDVINQQTIRRMKRSAYLINVARGGCVAEDALKTALNEDLIAGAGIDHFKEEPLPKDSPFWEMSNVLITSHTAGETRKYEDNVIDILLTNLEKLWAEDTALYNRII